MFIKVNMGTVTEREVNMNFWNKKLLNTKIQSEELEKKEMILGYLIGPSLMYLMTTALSGTYLMQFYTDVIGVSGSVIVLMPIISKIAVAIMNVLFSTIINRTNTAQGKARPWLLASGIILPISGIMLYMVPQASFKTQLLWILFSYNFFFVIALNIYHLAHSMMIPRSSRNSEERDKLSLFKNVSEGMIPGTLSAVIMPFIIRAIGVGTAAQSNWFKFMLVLSIIATPAALIEYFFTKERVPDGQKPTSLAVQFRESLKYKEWLIVMALIGLKYIESAFMSSSMIYYSNWVLGNSVDSGAKYQALLNVIGQFPLGIGVFAMVPLLKKYGKYRVMRIGFILAAIGSAIVYFSPSNFIIVLIGMFIRSIGSIPSMMSISMMSDVIDRIEKQSGHRFDSLGASMNAIMHTVSLGIGQTAILLSINALGYIVPQNTAQVISQPQALVSAFNFCMIGVSLICFIISFFLINRLNMENK